MKHGIHTNSINIDDDYDSFEKTSDILNNCHNLSDMEKASSAITLADLKAKGKRFPYFDCNGLSLIFACSTANFLNHLLFKLLWEKFGSQLSAEDLTAKIPNINGRNQTIVSYLAEKSHYDIEIYNINRQIFERFGSAIFIERQKKDNNEKSPSKEIIEPSLYEQGIEKIQKIAQGPTGTNHLLNTNISVEELRAKGEKEKGQFPNVLAYLTGRVDFRKKQQSLKN